MYRKSVEGRSVPLIKLPKKVGNKMARKLDKEIQAY